MIDLSSNIDANDWIHTNHFGSLINRRPNAFRQYSPLAELSYTERLSLIDDWHLIDQQSSTQIPQYVDIVVVENKYWKVVVPVHPSSQYETLMIPHKACTQFEDLSYAQRSGLATILGKLATRFDNLMMTTVGCEISWQRSESSVYGIYKPSVDSIYREPMTPQQLHINNLSLKPEKVAIQLRELSDIHFRDIFPSQ